MDILEYCARDITKGYHASGIAKELKLNQKTVSNHLNTFQKQGILTIRYEGRNKLFFFNKQNIKPLLLNIETNKQMNFLRKNKRIQAIISGFPKANMLIFGSYAKEINTKSSDLDIFIIGKYDEKKMKEEAKIWGVKLDIHTMSKKSFIDGLKNKDILLNEILRDHIIIDGFESFIDDFLKYYYKDFFLWPWHPSL